VTGFSTDKRYNVPWTLSAGYMGSCTLGCLMLFAGCEYISLHVPVIELIDLSQHICVSRDALEQHQAS
jgi:hypothetical protein